jgi:small conductance mechanosensitive channel
VQPPTFRLPTPPQPDVVLDSLRDSVEVPAVGRVAQRLLDPDSLQSIPRQLHDWWIESYVALIGAVPRLLAALVLASIVIAATLWLRGHVHVDEDPREDLGVRRQVGTAGLLLAVTVLLAIAGTTVAAAALLTFTVFYLLALALRLFGMRVLGRFSETPEAAELVLTVVRYALLTLGLVEALASLGLNVGGVIAGLGILGLAVGFAAQDTLANLIAGFVILWDRPLRVGDWISVGTATGRVRRITLRTTRIETRDEGILVIPNKEITGQSIYNYSLRNLARVRVPVHVALDTDVGRARQAMLAVVPDNPIISTRPMPEVAVTEFGDRGLRLELVLFVLDPREMMPLGWQLNEAVLLALREQGIAVTYPHLNVHVRGEPEAVGRLI